MLHPSIVRITPRKFDPAFAISGEAAQSCQGIFLVNLMEFRQILWGHVEMNECWGDNGRCWKRTRHLTLSWLRVFVLPERNCSSISKFRVLHGVITNVISIFGRSPKSIFQAWRQRQWCYASETRNTYQLGQPNRRYCGCSLVQHPILMASNLIRYFLDQVEHIHEQSVGFVVNLTYFRWLKWTDLREKTENIKHDCESVDF